MRLSQIVNAVISELFQECGNVITLHPAQRERVVTAIARRLKSTLEANGDGSPSISIDMDIYQRITQYIQSTIVTIEEGYEGHIEVSCRDCGAYYAGYSSASKDHVELIPGFKHKEDCLYMIITTEKI